MVHLDFQRWQFLFVRHLMCRFLKKKLHLWTWKAHTSSVLFWFIFVILTFSVFQSNYLKASSRLPPLRSGWWLLLGWSITTWQWSQQQIIGTSNLRRISLMEDGVIRFSKFLEMIRSKDGWRGWWCTDALSVFLVVGCSCRMLLVQ